MIGSLRRARGLAPSCAQALNCNGKVSQCREEEETKIQTGVARAFPRYDLQLVTAKVISLIASGL